MSELEVLTANQFSKKKTTFISVIGIIIGTWATYCYDIGAIAQLGWPLVTVIGLMVFGICFQHYVDSKCIQNN